MDWFEILTGFREKAYFETKELLVIEGDRLRSKVNGASYSIGALTLPTLRQLKQQAASGMLSSRRSKVSIVICDVGSLHADPDAEGALFQVASQFNALEMINPSISPEHGVTMYEDDGTQGPACAVAAGAATIYRNYFAPVGERRGQTADHQIDTLADVRDHLAKYLQCAPADLWSMRNGYLTCSSAALERVCKCLQTLRSDELESLRATFRIALHSDVEVTSARLPGHLVSQAFCSAIPIAYSQIRQAERWRPFAAFVLSAAYEATLLAAAINARRGKSSIVFLTLLGGGAFGNEPHLILQAMKNAITTTEHCGLDVRIVAKHAPTAELLELVSAWS